MRSRRIPHSKGPSPRRSGSAELSVGECSCAAGRIASSSPSALNLSLLTEAAVCDVRATTDMADKMRHAGIPWMRNHLALQLLTSIFLVETSVKSPPRTTLSVVCVHSSLLSYASLYDYSIRRGASQLSLPHRS